MFRLVVVHGTSKVSPLGREQASALPMMHAHAEQLHGGAGRRRDDRTGDVVGWQLTAIIWAVYAKVILGEGAQSRKLVEKEFADYLSSIDTSRAKIDFFAAYLPQITVNDGS